jgi:cytochrome c biogenesis protein CcmG, thiol:disulfide interchange protein DsbE
MRRRFTLALALLAGLSLTAFVAGCGSSSEGATTTHPNYAKALKGAPAPLAALYAEGNQLLPGGKDALEKRIGELGHPTVVNIWASWCNPCRIEFAMFQQVAPKYGKKVAFLGADSEDAETEAKEWLKDHPVPYPSYFEEHSAYAASLKLFGPPDTAYYDAKGELVFVKHGEYGKQSELEADIKKYALESS